MDERQAMDLRNYLTTISNKYQKHSCWELIEKGSFGYDLHVEKNKIIPISAVVDDMKSKRHEFIQNYIKELRAL